MHVKNNIWAAGSVCSFYDEVIGIRRRLEQWEHAQISGRVAGENMTNGNKKYTHQGAFNSVICGENYINGVGDVNPQLDTNIHDEEDKTLKAVIFYLRDERIVGICFLNIFGFAIDIGRRIITDAQKHQNNFVDLVKLFVPFPVNDEEKNQE